MIKLIIFDLDGVLVESKQLHFEAFNYALEQVDPQYAISYDDHLTKYDGLSTKKKLELLTKERGLPENFYDQIWLNKQDKTVELMGRLKPDHRIAKILKQLKEKFTIACCTNSIHKTAVIQLQRKKLIEQFSLLLTNEDVKNTKPSAEIYMRCMLHFNINPDETLIVEDSYVGRKAAVRSGAHVLPVNSPKDLTLQRVENFIMKIDNENSPKNKWKDEKLNILIPMAGAGSRFEKAGFTFPKPLIDVDGKPMIQVVVDNINIEANYIFIVQQSHLEKYNLKQTLNLIAPGCEVVAIDGVTEGAACTTLLAKKYINNNKPLLIANSDQFVEWDSGEFMYNMVTNKVDAGILTFKSTHPKWSYAKCDENGFVTKVAEKKPISDIATVGIYYWKKGKDYVKYAEQMVKNDIRVNNEFYVCPVFNEAIQDGKKIKCFDVKRMWGIGTPEDLNYFLTNYVNNIA